MVQHKVSAKQLIDQYVDPNPHGTGRQDAHLKVSGVSVWILVNRLLTGTSIHDLAEEYHLPEQAVEAARAYYERYPELIDARILINNAFFEE